MGYSIEVCYKCIMADTSANLEYDSKSDRYYHGNKCFVKTHSLEYDQVKEIIDSITGEKRYISSKTLMAPSCKTAQEYLKRFGMEWKKKQSIDIWKQFWRCIDYMIENHEDQETETYQKYQKFVDDLLY